MVFFSIWILGRKPLTQPGVSLKLAGTNMHNHAATEQLLREAGMPWTSLRNGFYASTIPFMMGGAATTGVIAAPADDKVSWITHGDLAAAIAVILRDEGRFEGPTPPLTAAEALDLQDVAATLSELHSKPIRREVLTDEAYTAQLIERGTPLPVVNISLGMYRAARAGEFTAVDPTLAGLIGRKPTSLRDILAIPREPPAAPR